MEAGVWESPTGVLDKDVDIQAPWKIVRSERLEKKLLIGAVEEAWISRAAVRGQDDITEACSRVERLEPWKRKALSAKRNVMASTATKEE